MVSRIWLLRHGQVTSNLGEGRFNGWDDESLTQEGLRQARATASWLASEHIDAVYSSAIYRARQTAEIIAEPHGLPVNPLSDLNEVYYGDWIGKSFSDLQKSDPETASKWRARPADTAPQNGEKCSDAMARMARGMGGIADSLNGRSAVVVAHGSINRLFLTHILGTPINDFEHLNQKNCCINILLYEDGRWFIETVNDTSHLTSVPVP